MNGKAIGALALAMAAILSGCDGRASPGATSSNAAADASPTPAPQVGRFVIYHSPHVEADTVLLDTATGDSWRQETTSGHDLTKSDVEWVPIPRLSPAPALDTAPAPDPGPSEAH